eukprot:12481026-Alexandrium_andersonii.AAC.1
MILDNNKHNQLQHMRVRSNCLRVDGAQNEGARRLVTCATPAQRRPAPRCAPYPPFRSRSR